MSNLPIFDIAIIIVYLLAMGLVLFSKRNKNSVQFTSASGKIPGGQSVIDLCNIFKQ
jgi:SSS family solute:Na+ symporter